MSSFLLRQFTEKTRVPASLLYCKFFGNKRAKILNSIIPDLTQNLTKSSVVFLESLAAYDT